MVNHKALRDAYIKLAVSSYLKNTWTEFAQEEGMTLTALIKTAVWDYIDRRKRQTLAD